MTPDLGIIQLGETSETPFDGDVTYSTVRGEGHIGQYL